jgi:hypothetical protein
MELNEQIMELVRADLDMMTDLAVQGADAIRTQMQSRRKLGHGMMMHDHGQE